VVAVVAVAVAVVAVAVGTSCCYLAHYKLIR